MLLTDIAAGQILEGVLPQQSVTVVACEAMGPAVHLTFRTPAGQTTARLVYADEAAQFTTAQGGGPRYDADPAEYRLALEARRIELASLFDPMLAVTTSDVQPLPHQISAVYEHLLPQSPLRFLLADDPGAGKTVMAGLYLKELMLRGDVQRCLVVAPGGLVEQWQDELLTKFGLRFEILSTEMFGAPDADVFGHHPMLIARMDQLARNEIVIDQLRDSEWDLAIVDEAHRMSANYFGAELKYTKRFQLGQVLGDVARHLLLMTATPHNGKEEDYQQFLTLLDRDRFEGRHRKDQPPADTTGIMRRMIKEELLTFEGRRLFPAREAETVPYALSPAEKDLYEAVSEYVRDEMDRAESLDGKRRSSVGFALTVLQRRLASSPEAIYRSLMRRVDRLEQRLADHDRPAVTATRDRYLDSSTEQMADEEELDAEELEHLEDEVVDAASAAQTREEIEHEIVVVRGLVALASGVRAGGEDRKWIELRQIIDDERINQTADGHARKLIVFTEHRDTLEYLERQIRNQLGRDDAVVSIHGGVPRARRRAVTAEFTGNPDVRVLVATDAAGEGLNLQVAHLMVNYDLPWNPNRIDQRFGRIHRIGQREVCRLWNLVSVDTREGQVYERLLGKLADQHRAYGGKVFEVLGQGFQERSLRDLLIEAIRHGDDPAVRAEMDRVIDASVGANVQEILEGEALATESMSALELDRLRAEMDDARSRRLQPFFIERFFRDAFRRLGGRMRSRRGGQLEITNVPVRLRTGVQSVVRPVATKYERVTFAIDTTGQPGERRAELLAPGHPLFDVVVRTTIGDLGHVLDQGAAFISPELTSPQVLVGLENDLRDGTGSTVERAFGFSFVDSSGDLADAGPAPHLDAVALDSEARRLQVSSEPWVAAAPEAALRWSVEHQLPSLLMRVEERVHRDVDRTRERVVARLTGESDRLYAESLEASQAQAEGKRTKQSADALVRRAAELEARRDDRVAALEVRWQVTATLPRIVTSALFLPPESDSVTPGLTSAPDPDLRDETDRRAIAAVMSIERAAGHEPQEMPHNNRGFDIRTTVEGETTFIEVKGRREGADTFAVSASEVLHGKNNVGHHVLALVSVSESGALRDEVRYLRDEFEDVELATMETTHVFLDWKKTWAKGFGPT